MYRKIGFMPTCYTFNSESRPRGEGTEQCYSVWRVQRRTLQTQWWLQDSSSQTQDTVEGHQVSSRSLTSEDDIDK